MVHQNILCFRFLLLALCRNKDGLLNTKEWILRNIFYIVIGHKQRFKFFVIQVCLSRIL